MGNAFGDASFLNGFIIHVILRLNTILPFLDDLLLSNEYVLKLNIWRVSSGHRNGKLSQTYEAGKHEEVDHTLTAILYIFALFSSHFNSNTYVHNFQNAYAWVFTVEINKLSEIKNIFKTRKKINNVKKNKS